ncbi:MAG TPA: YdbH domain-containing protein [Rhizomicrobium sp.]|nr:YdbH domain-containing protein [Rhizomicrobium sp.]
MKRSGGWRRAAGIGAILAVAFCALVYVTRTFVFARLAEIYLLARGVPSSISIGRLDWGGLDASVRLGARRTPDLAIGNLHAEFSGDWIPRLVSLTLQRPTLRVAFDGEKLSFGTLQRLVDSFLAPATPQISAKVEGQSPGMRIVLDDARVLAFTPAGVLSISGGGAIAGGRIEQFAGKIGRANLRSSGMALLLSGGNFSARDDGSGLMLHVGVRGRRLYYSNVRVGDVQAAFDIHGLDWGGASYSMTSASALLRAGAVKAQSFSIARADIRAGFGAWRAAGPAASGSVRAAARLTGMRTEKADAETVVLGLQSQALKLEKPASIWRLSGPVAETAEISAGRYRFRSAALSIPWLVSQAKGEMSVGDRFTGSLTVSVRAGLSMPRNEARRFARTVPVAGGDARTVRAIASAFAGMTLDAPEIYAGKSAASLIVALPAPVALSSSSGARAKFAQSGDVFVLRDPHGGMSGGIAAALSGGGLPAVNLWLPHYTARRDKSGLTFQSAASLSARLSLGAFKDARIAARGNLSQSQGRMAFAADGCIGLGLGAYVSREKPLLGDLRTALCPMAQKPLLVTEKEGWKLGGTLRNFSARLSQAETLAKGRESRIEISGDAKGLENGFVRSADIRLTDARAKPRFAPLFASGALTLAKGKWAGTIGLTAAKTKRALAAVAVRHDMRTGAGEAQIVSDLAFAPDGMQPGEISPLLATLTQARGAAQFAGRVVWTKDDMTSGGTLIVADSDFIGPMGTFRRAAAHIVFTSLAPLETASSQSFSAQKIDWHVPFSDLLLRFRLARDAFRLESFDAAAAQGHVALAPMTVRLESGAQTEGTLKLDNVNLSALIAASNLSDKISLDAPVKGAIPFRYGPSGFRVRDGYFVSTGPSRLSIRRTVWTGGKAEETGAIRDFAYQALENLAIDDLDAKLNSLPAGRLGVVFHIKGRNDPAIAQETRISLISLIRGHAFDKPVPLPKGTPVDLTLDTSLNFDELLDAYRKAFSADLAQAAETSQDDEGKTP